MKILYKVKTGKNIGSIYEPHKHDCGKYVVSKTRFKADYVYVNSYEDIVRYLDLGFGVRVSDPKTRNSPSLVKKASLEITRT